MREVKLSNGECVTVKPLTGKAVREIMAMPSKEDFSVVFETLDRAGFPEAMADELPFPDIVKLHKAINAETFGSEDEIKN